MVTMFPLLSASCRWNWFSVSGSALTAVTIVRVLAAGPWGHRGWLRVTRVTSRPLMRLRVRVIIRVILRVVTRRRG